MAGDPTPPEAPDSLPADSIEDEPTPVEWTATATVTDYRLVGAALLTDVSAAPNEGFDRIILELQGPEMPSYRVEYVDSPIQECGSGEVVPIEGTGWLSIRLEPANAHTEAGESSVQQRALVPGLTTLRELRLICDFEAQVEWIAGVSAPNRYRVMELSEPTRLIVDIRH